MGQRLNEEPDRGIPLQDLLQEVAVTLKLKPRTLYYAMAFHRLYPDLSVFPEGKNITWSKIVKEYLTEGKEQGRDEMSPTPPSSQSPVLDPVSAPAPASYTEYVRSKPCCECGKEPAQYAHFPRTGAAGGKFGIPMCGSCHMDFHRDPKEWTWENRPFWEIYLEELVSNLFKEK